MCSILTVVDGSHVVVLVSKHSSSFSMQKHLAETDFQFPGVHTNGGPSFHVGCPRTAASQSGRPSRGRWSSAGGRPELAGRFEEGRVAAKSAQQLMSHSCARRGKIGVQTAETTGGTATQRIYITVNWQNYRQLPCHSFTPTLLQWTRRRFHAFSCTEGHTWEGKPGSVSRGCLGFLVCLQSRRCYTVFFLDFFLFFWRQNSSDKHSDAQQDCKSKRELERHALKLDL